MPVPAPTSSWISDVAIPDSGNADKCEIHHFPHRRSIRTDSPPFPVVQRPRPPPRKKTWRMEVHSVPQMTPLLLWWWYWQRFARRLPFGPHCDCPQRIGRKKNVPWSCPSYTIKTTFGVCLVFCVQWALGTEQKKSVAISYYLTLFS